MLRRLQAVRNERKECASEERQWALRGYEAPSPSYIKRKVLLRHNTPQSIWVETGTFMGDTTAFLAQISEQVYTIEPEPDLFSKAEDRFHNLHNVSVFHGLSEVVFPELLPKLTGNVHFWLDGHYSGGITHQGPTDCPIREELRCIEDNIAHFDQTIVLVDDVRCFDPRNPLYSDYPPLDDLVDWSRKNKMHWHIEHDIFIAQSIS